MKTNVRRSSNGNLTYEGTIGKLYETATKISTAEARLWLFKHLQKKKLTTRDIYFFAIKQAGQRLENKDPDPLTVKYAMLAKLRDIGSLISRLYRVRKKLEQDLFTELNEKRFKFRKEIKKVRELASQTKEKKIKDYEAKIEHYEKSQRKIEMPGKKKTPDFSNKATSLTDYESLSIFGGPKALPSAEPPLGPYICDKTIKLSKNELSVLSKTPKFNVRLKIQTRDMKVEVERMLAKHRYGKSNFKSKKFGGRHKLKKSPEEIAQEAADLLKVNPTENHSDFLIVPFYYVIR